MVKKVLLLGLLTLGIFMFWGCRSRTQGSTIVVISREDGSGARSVFEELVDVNRRADGLMRQDAIISNGNGVVASSIESNPLAIGYISWATFMDLQNDLRGLYIDGVAPTAMNMISGEYQLVRPFNFVYSSTNIGEVERAFISFARSREGRGVLSEVGAIVDPLGAAPFNVDAFDLVAIDRQAARGSIAFGGSTSTEATALALISEFEVLFPQVDITYEAVGSGTGLRGVQQGFFTLGFVSRDLYESEVANGLNKVTYALDGIVIAVHPDRDTTDLSLEQVRDIYRGIITDWTELR